MGSKPEKRLANLETFDGEVEKRLSGKRVATVLVHHDNHILVGVRRDTGKYTLPGGHLEAHEEAHEGSKRELHEETGHLAQGNLQKLGQEVLEPSEEHPKRLELSTYAYAAPERFQATSKHDPDNEVSRWEWVDVSKGLPDHVKQNLQHKPNHALVHAGLMNY